MINCLIAFNSNQIENFLNNFRFTGTRPDVIRERTDFDVFEDDNNHILDPYNRNQLAVYVHASKMWKERVQGGPVMTRLVTLYIQNIQQLDGKLSMIEYLRTFFDGRFTPLGVWYASGAEYTTANDEMIEHGQTITRATYDNEGNELTPEIVDGNGTYPLIPKAAYLNYMPNNLDGSPATEFKQVHLLQNHNGRRV